MINDNNIFTFINVDLDADLKDCIMVAARSLERWTGLLLQVSVDSTATHGTVIFNLWHSSMKQAEVFVMLLDNKN